MRSTSFRLAIVLSIAFLGSSPAAAPQATSAPSVPAFQSIGPLTFGADGVLFADIDVLAVGPVVDEVSQSFETYWSSESARPADRLLPSVSPAAREELGAAARRTENSPKAASQSIPSAPIPKVANPCGTRSRELRVRGTSLFDGGEAGDYVVRR